MTKLISLQEWLKGKEQDPGPGYTRHEIIGREGGHPPIYIIWTDGPDLDRDKIMGIYSKPSIDKESEHWGEMFGKEPIRSPDDPPAA